MPFFHFRFDTDKEDLTKMSTVLFTAILESRKSHSFTVASLSTSVSVAVRASF